MFMLHLHNCIDVLEVPDKNNNDSWHNTVIRYQTFTGSPQGHLATIFAVF